MQVRRFGRVWVGGVLRDDEVPRYVPEREKPNALRRT